MSAILKAIRAYDSAEKPVEFNFEALDACRIDLANPPPKPIAVFKLGGQQICTAGNITVVSAQAKRGKSAVVGAMIAAVACWEPGADMLADCFGFVAAASGGKAILLFDSEQSKHDSHNLIKRATNRVDLRDFPDNFRCYYLVEFSLRFRREALRAELARAARKCGGIHSVFIDGIADFCLDPNSTEEAFSLVEEIVQLATEYDCPIIVVLHENPARVGEAGKTRGHLGSQLERKAESNLRVEKDGNDVCTIFSDKCRSANIPKDKGARFIWSPIEERHISVSPEDSEEVSAQKRRERETEIRTIFGTQLTPMAWSDLMAKLESKLGIKGSSAERWIRESVGLGSLQKLPGKKGYLAA